MERSATAQPRLLRCLLRAGAGLLLGLALQAQTQAYRRYDDRDGLPQSQVHALLEDRDGFVWAGTAEGLARLGSSGIHAFGATQGLRTANINDLLQDRGGSIWVAGQESGVAEIRGSKVQLFGPDQGLAVSTVYSLLEDEEGRLLAGTRLGLFRKEGDRFRKVELPGDWNQMPIFALGREARGGGIWLGSLKGNLARWDGTRLEVAALPIPVSSRFRRFSLDAAGHLWALCGEALFRLGADGRWARDPLPGLTGKPRLRSFQMTAQGELLLALDTDGLYLRKRGEAGRVLNHLDGLPKDGVSSVLRDSRGVLWIGSDGAGLMAEAVPGLRTLESDPETGIGLGLGSVLCFQEAGPGRMLIGCSTGLRLWQEGRGIIGKWDLAKGLPSNEVWSMAPRPGGGVWVATIKGLVRWVDGRIEPGPKEVAALNVVRLLPHEGRLWVATLEQGLLELDPQGRFLARHPTPKEVGEPAILALLPQPGGVLVATRCGLYVLEHGQYRPFLRNTPVAAAAVTCLHQDPDGAIWVGTDSDGLYGFPKGEGGPWEHYGEGNAQLHGSISWVSRLRNGALAVGHAKGVSLIFRGRTLLLTRNLGLLSNETSESAVKLDSKGRLWIGMVGGLCLLDTATDLPTPLAPRPAVLDASVDGRPCWAQGRITLPPSPGALTIRYDAGNPLLPLPPRFETRIEGVDKGWRPVEDADNSIQIAHLGPGSYRFWVRSSLDGNTWAVSEPVPIHVRAAWFQTLSMRVVGILAVLGLGVLLVQWRLLRARTRAVLLEGRVKARTEDLAARTEELALRNRALERLHHQLKLSLEGRIQFMNTVVHDLRSPLSSIVLVMDRIGEIEEVPGDIQTGLKIIDRETHRVEHLLRNFLDQSRTENLTGELNFRVCHPREILEGLTETLELKAEAKGLVAHLALDPGGDPVWVLADTAAMQQVVFNLVENALKFTEAPGTVGITTRLEPTTWVLEVWDTGRGIEPEKIEELFDPFIQAAPADALRGWGLGLNICKSIVQSHEGRIVVTSEVGRGSRFKVCLPLLTSHREAGS